METLFLLGCPGPRRTEPDSACFRRCPVFARAKVWFKSHLGRMFEEWPPRTVAHFSFPARLQSLPDRCLQVRRYASPALILMFVTGDSFLLLPRVSVGTVQ